MRENHVFFMYYLEILFTFIDKKVLNPATQKLLTAARHLMLALHLTKGTSLQVRYY